MRFFKPVLFFALFLSLAACSQDSDSKGKKSKKNIDDATEVAESPEVPFVPCVKKDLADQITAKVIYGEDNRLEYCETSRVDQMALSDSTAVLVRKTDLSQKNSTTLKYNATTFGQLYNLCKEEPFRDQLSAGFCSGFLVSPDTIVTAGHCIRTQTTCNSTAFIFGFNVKSVGAYPTETSVDEVYNCSTLVKSVVEASGKDYAVIKLDRPVVGHNPLKLRQGGSLSVNDSVVVMGYPSGIPLKISGGAKVRSLQKGYFVANLDTYGGNSGSAVFNEVTGEVEGILVRGEADFVTQGTCRASNRCKDDACRGEDVTTIAEVLGDL